MAEKAYIVHHTPGRVRIRVPSKRDHIDFFRNIDYRLSELSSIHRVVSNPETASVLIYYKGELPKLLLESAMAGLGEVVEVEMGLPPIEPISEKLRTRLVDMSKTISRSTGGAIDGNSAVVLSFLMACLLQMARGQVLGPAVPLLWYAAQAIGGIWPDRVAQPR